MHAKSILNSRNLAYGSLILIGLNMNLSASAQATNQAIYLPPGQSNQGAPPPPGAGETAPIVTPGDSQKRDVVTGKPTSTPELGTNFPHEQEKRRARIKLFMNGKEVLTFQPDQLTNEQYGKVMGVIGNVVDNQPYQNISVSKDQLVEMQDALAPSPNTNAERSAVPMPKPTRNGVTNRSQIVSDTPAPGALQHGTNNVVVFHEVIKNFCRYIVIMGVVCGCIFLAFAAIGLQFGDRSAGGRIIGSVAGIMLLLMGYSIWKVIRFNENNARGPENRVVDLSTPPPLEDTRKSPGDVNRVKNDDSFTSTTEANLPVIPPNPGGIQRSGLPLKPLGAAH